jgi:hypothetical protein
MRYHHPHYLELPLPIHADEAGRHAHPARHRHRHWLLIAGLILLAILLIGVTVTGGGR